MTASFSGPVEFSPLFAPRPRITHAVFDFDGTVSWLRHGWPELMYAVLRKHLCLKPGESEQQLHDLLLRDILSLNGKPSIHQIERGRERMLERGVENKPAAEELLLEYQSRLEEAIAERSEGIVSGRSATATFLVFGVKGVLDSFKHRGIKMAILSGTQESKVKQEAKLLEIDSYFGRHIYGSTNTGFSKRAVLDRLLAEENISGATLLSFGDGPVEIRHTKELGGLAVGVASDENIHGSGAIDPAKHELLLEAGADLVIPDYRDTDALTDCLFSKEE
jgi:phosphoglycolate phosphatase